jgi:HlyD family secretion protein
MKTLPPSPAPATALSELLGNDAGPSRWRRIGPWLLGAVLIAAAGAGLWFAFGPSQTAAVRYTSEPLTRGDLALTVTANGKIQPTRSVSIGSELSGIVARVRVDVNDRVKKGQVLVELDTAKLLDQITRTRASLAAAQAGVAQAAAAAKEARANLARLEEVQRLSGGQVPAPAEMDSARAVLDKAIAEQASAQAAVAQARATLSTDETNLGRASIRSPIDGVVLTRSVDPGNAVAASLQAVTLFTLAEDLAQLQLSVNVDEADVAQVQIGQPASFTVSAWAGRRYPATVSRVAYGSTLTDNVVTYTTLLSVDNTDLSLRPGMTAVATVATNERKQVWLVTNRALRFTPSVAAPAAGSGAEAAKSGGVVAQLMPRIPGTNRPRSATTAAPVAGQAGRIWVQQGSAAPRSIAVSIGLSNGRQTEVSGDELREGLQVLTGETSAGAQP